MGFFLLLLSFYQSYIVISWNISLFKAWSDDKLNRKFLVAENFAELGAFDRLNWQHSGNLTKIFQKSQMPGVCPGGGGGGVWFWN